MSARVCLVTTGQPSTNPRLVKEADALAAHGYIVHVVGAHWADWADRADVELLRARRWSCQLVDGRREGAAWLFWKSRVRHRAARSAFRMPIVGRAFANGAAGRLTPELSAAASASPADLYIAHNLGALPAAAAAARRHGARLGFDAEDYHRGELAADDTAAIALAAHIEEQYLPQCDYVTAASPGIAAAYAPLCKTPPVVILNVFPRSDRPAAPMARRDGPFRLYWFSQTIGRDRGLEQVVGAMGILRDLPIELHLRGAWQAGYQSHLEQTAPAAGVDWGRVVSHAPAPPAEMIRIAAAYDAGLALEASRTTNADILLSNKIFTYLLAGLPVLASATTAQRALVRELGAAAVIAPIDDAETLALMLRPWVENPEALADARRTAWRLGETRFNWDHEQRVFLEVVQTVMGDGLGRRAVVAGLAS